MKDPEVIKLSYNDFIFKFGRAVVGAAKATIWSGSVTTFNTLNQSTNELFSLISSSADDKVGSGGATHAKFIYQKLDGLEYESEEIALNGLTAVDVPDITGVISYRVWITKSEDSDEITGPNHGIIKLYKTGTPATIFAEAPATEGQTLMCIYRVPSNKYAELESVSLDASEGKAATIWLRVRKDRASAWRTRATYQVFENGREQSRKNPEFIYPGSDVVIIGIAGAAGTTIDAHFQLKLHSLDD